MNKRSIVGIVDEPEFRSENQGKDGLKVVGYYNALADFIRHTDTPMTIGVQGNWGSGKTTLMNHLWKSLGGYEQHDIKKPGKDTKAAKEGMQNEWVENKKAGSYVNIWVNSWEHSLMATPEEALIKIIQHVTLEILAFSDQGQETWNKIKKHTENLAKSGLRMTTAVFGGVAAEQAVRDLIENKPANSVKQLREELQSVIENICTSGSDKKFVVYIDDLDRLDPTIAVKMLELLKNIFSLKHCVFVLAIDYQVVVKGLRAKYGEKSDQNEREYRFFFDKIIQLPFTMPAEGLDIGGYVVKLLNQVGYLEERKGNDPKIIDTVTKVMECTIGGNPRSIKRMVNNLSLIRRIAGHISKDDVLRTPDGCLRLFALVCCQIAYPEIYKILKENTEFSKWDDEFAKRKTLGKEKEMDGYEEAKKSVEGGSLWDDPWELALFRICYASEELRPKANQVSALLNMFAGGESESSESSAIEVSDEELKRLLEMSDVTSIATETIERSSTSAWKSETDKEKASLLWGKIFKAVEESHPESIFKNEGKLLISGVVRRKSKKNKYATFIMGHFPVSLALFIESDERTVSTRHFKKLKSKKDVIEEKLGPIEWIPSKRQRQQVRLMADPKLNKEIKKSRRSSGDQTPPEDCHDKIVEFFRQNTKNFVETLEDNLTKTQKTQ